MRRSRPVLVALLAVFLLCCVSAGDGAAGQYPHGLLAATPYAKGCVIETRPVSFGSYNPIDPVERNGLGQVTYTCGGKPLADTNAVKNVRIEMSRGYSNSYSDRAMTAGIAEYLHYNVYLDAIHTQIWGDGSNGTDYYFDPRPPKDTPVTVFAYGRIDARQDVPAGQYVDLLEVTILF